MTQPDPDPLTVPEPEPPSGCAWLAIMAAILVFWATVALIVATPRSTAVIPSPDQTEGSTREADQRSTGAPQSVSPLWQGTVTASPAGRGASLPAGRTVTTERPNPTPAPLAAIARLGVWAWADPAHGARYLAIPAGAGHIVRVCGPAACLLRVSTDAGPVPSLQRAGRIGDLSAADFTAICRVPLALGLCQGSWTIEGRLPETDAR